MSKEQVKSEEQTYVEAKAVEAEAVPAWMAVEQALAQHRGKKRMARHALRRGRGPSPAIKAADSGLPVLYLTETVARQTSRILDPEKPERLRMMSPQVVYWFGFECGERACVTTLMIPEEESRADSILASAVANEEVFAAIVQASLKFLGQVRLLDDDEEADAIGSYHDVRFDGAFSIEIPRGCGFDLAQCRVHRQVEGASQKIRAGSLDEHLRLIPGFKDLRSARPPVAHASLSRAPQIRHVVQV